MSKPFLVALILLGMFTDANGQETTVIVGKPPKDGPRSFSGAGATPISGTTVLQFYMEARDSGGARLAYALAIRGSPGWYQRRTTWNAVDTIPGYNATLWSVGDLTYLIAYSPADHRLRTFGREFDLQAGNVILVALDPSGPSQAPVMTQTNVPLVMLEPGGAAAALLRAGPDVAAFAGLPSR
jgi:hypothetical protein